MFWDVTETSVWLKNLQLIQHCHSYFLQGKSGWKTRKLFIFIYICRWTDIRLWQSFGPADMGGNTWRFPKAVKILVAPVYHSRCPARLRSGPVGTLHMWQQSQHGCGHLQMNVVFLGAGCSTPPGFRFHGATDSTSKWIVLHVPECRWVSLIYCDHTHIWLVTHLPVTITTTHSAQEHNH